MKEQQKSTLEEALIASEIRYRRLFESAKDGIIILDANTGKIVDVNPYLLEMLGYSHEELLGKELWEIGTLTNIAGSKEAFLELQNKGYIRYEDMPLETKNGKHVEVEFVSNIYFVDSTKIIQCNIRDITERKLSEQKLKESEARYRLLFETSADGILIADVETKKFKYANPALCQMLGYTEEELTTLGLSDIHPEQAFQHAIAKFESLTHGEKNLASDIPCLRKDGSIIYADINSTSITIDGRKYNVGIFRDITERKRAEQSLLRINKAVEGSGEAICMSDPQGHHFYHNKAFTEFFEYTVEEIQAAGGGTVVYVNKDVGRKVFDTIMDGGTWNGEVEMSSKRGRKFTVLLRADSIKDENGIIVGLVGIHTDITERKRTEESLRFFRMMIDKSQDAIEVIDVETARFIDVNEKACNDLGYSRSELLNMGVFDIDPNQNMHDFQKMILNIEQSNSMTVESLHRRKDGSMFPVEINIAVVKLDKTYTIAIVRDITERKKLETNLSNAAELAKLGYWEFDVKSGNFIFDDQYYRLIHGSSTEIQGGNIMSAEEFVRRLVHPDDSKMIAKNLQEAITSTDPEYLGHAETRVFRDNGDITYVIVHFKVLKDQFENPLTVYGINQDITERKKAEETLKESEENFRSMFENNSAAMAIIEPDTTMSMVNDEYCKLSGYSKQETIGSSWTNLIPPEDIERLKEFNRRRMINASDAPDKYEFTIYNKKGEIRHALMSVMFLRNKKLIASFLDITERKLAEEVLSESERRTRALLNANPDMIFRVNREGIFLDYKADSAELYAQAETSIIGKKNRDITPPEFADLIDRYIGQTLDSGELQEFEYQMISPKRRLA